MKRIYCLVDNLNFKQNSLQRYDITFEKVKLLNFDSQSISLVPNFILKKIPTTYSNFRLDTTKQCCSARNRVRTGSILFNVYFISPSSYIKKECKLSQNPDEKLLLTTNNIVRISSDNLKKKDTPFFRNSLLEN